MIKDKFLSYNIIILWLLSNKIDELWWCSFEEAVIVEEYKFSGAAGLSEPLPPYTLFCG